MAFSLPASVCQLISRLESAGYEAYAVGGCVRDMLCRQNASRLGFVYQRHALGDKGLFSGLYCADHRGKTRHDHSAVER